MTPQGGLGSIRGENPGGNREGAGLASEPPGTMGNTAQGALFRFLMRQVLWGTQHSDPPVTMGNTALGALLWFLIRQ